MIRKGNPIKRFLLFGLFISLLVMITSSRIIFADESDQKETEEIEAEFDPSIEKDRSVTIGDPDSLATRAARIGARIHPEALEIGGLKKDRFGLIDWAQIIRDGKISPKISVDPKGGRDRFEDWLILFENVAGFDVLFPHDVHTYWLDCKSCHDVIFKDKYRANTIRMKEIVEGKWCGICHGVVAFPVEECPRCHVKITAEE